MKRKILPIICITLALSAGCVSSHPEKKPERITLAFQEFIGYGPVYLAHDKGFFKEEGVSLMIVGEQLDSARREAFKAGMLDMEIGTLDLLVSKRALNAPIVSVMEIDHSVGADGIVAIDAVKTLKDLAGKRVALARDDVGETLLSYLFYKEGLSMSEVTIVPARPEEAAGVFLKGEADAVATWEPWLSKALERPGSHILVTTKDHPEIIVDTLNVREEVLRQNPEAVKGVMRAWFKALKYYKDHPEEASDIIAGHYGIDGEKYRQDIKRLEWVEYNEQMVHLGSGKLAEIFKVIANVKLNSGRIPGMPEAESAINEKFIKDIYEDKK